MSTRLEAEPPLAGLHILSLATPATSQRDSARQMVRQALLEALDQLLPGEKERIALTSVPGEPIRLAAPWQEIGLSVSHEPGLSLAAIHLGGPVGIDLMQLGPALPDSAALSRDYLGPAIATELAGLPEADRPLAFARAWTSHEARLKCLGLPLDEWTPDLAARLASCTIAEVTLPAGWVATVAIARDMPTRRSGFSPTIGNPSPKGTSFGASG